MSEIKRVYHKKSGEKGYLWNDIIFVVDDLEDRTPEEALKPILSWLENQNDETLKSISIICVDAFYEFMDLFFTGEEKKLKGKPGDYSFSVYSDGLSGTKNSFKRVWEKMGRERNDWTQDKPFEWEGENKKVWDNNLDRKDIWD